MPQTSSGIDLSGVSNYTLEGYPGLIYNTGTPPIIQAGLNSSASNVSLSYGIAVKAGPKSSQFQAITSATDVPIGFTVNNWFAAPNQANPLLTQDVEILYGNALSVLRGGGIWVRVVNSGASVLTINNNDLVYILTNVTAGTFNVITGPRGGAAPANTVQFRNCVSLVSTTVAASSTVDIPVGLTANYA